jgi:uracil-DNA glycosylase family 4
MPDLNALLGEIEAEARRKEFPIDRPVYEAVGKDPLVPIAYGGSFAARVCSFGRDPGRDEIKYGQPQVGAAGKLVRKGVLSALGKTPQRDDPRLEEALQYVFLSNTVPYKPPGNKAYPDSVKERFRPYIAQLLLSYWKGDVVITLGTEAFQWFAPYAPPGQADEFWKREDRYEAEFTCVLTVETKHGKLEKRITVCPLPHPSPLNQRWIGLFPGLLEARLKRWLAAE